MDHSSDAPIAEFDGDDGADATTSAVAPAPGGPHARSQGCRCSVLANAAHRTDADAAPVFDFTCPITAHAERAPVTDEARVTGSDT